MSFRQDLLRFAAPQPKQGRSSDVIQGPSVRVKIFGHPDHTLIVEEMPKRGVRRVRQMTFETWWDVRNNRNGGDNFMVENLLLDARLNKAMSYDQAVAAFRKAIEMAKATAGGPTSRFGTTEHETTVSTLEIEPTDYKPIQFEGKDFFGVSKWGEFKFQNKVQKDQAYHPDGMTDFYSSKSAGGARKLFKYLKANPAAIKSLTLEQFKAWLTTNKVAFSFTPTYWR